MATIARPVHHALASMSCKHILDFMLASDFLKSRRLHFMQILHEDTGNAYHCPCMFAANQKEDLQDSGGGS